MNNKAKETTMKSDVKPALAPTLRFPEFLNGTSWTSKPMGEVYSFKSNNSLSRDQLNYEHGSIRNIHYGDIHTKFSTLFDITKEAVPFINPSESIGGFRPENDCVEGDMIFADASEDMEGIGKSIEVVHLNGERVVAGQHTILARPNDNHLVVGFGAYLFKSRRVRAQIQKESQGAKVLGISATRLTKIQLPIPITKAEQQKIAECLSSVDELIAAQARKLNALKTHKKGLMQQLFPRDGETQPRLRFPEFQNAQEWRAGPISQFAQINPRREVRPDEVEVSFVPMSAVSENGFLAVQHTRKYGSVKKGFTAFRDCDVILAKITPCFENGKAALVRALKNEVGFGSTEFHVIRAQKSCLPEFIFAQVYSDQFRRLGKASMTGTGGHQRVPASFIEDYVIYVPELPEQQRIADCLATLDDLIAAQTQKFDALNTHKKGLMQQLFPSPLEVDV